MDAIVAYHSDSDSSLSPRPSSPLQQPPPPSFSLPTLSHPPTPDTFLVLVFLPLPSPTSSPAFSNFLAHLTSLSRLLLVNAPYKPSLTYLPSHRLHISLSRASTIPSSKIPALLRALAAAASTTPASVLTLTNSLLALPAQTADRAYLAAAVETSLTPVIAAVDEAVAAVGMPPFFDNALAHASFAHTEGRDLLEIASGSSLARNAPRRSIDIPYREIFVTVGCQTRRFPLAAREGGA